MERCCTPGERRLCQLSPSIHVTVPYPGEVERQPGLEIHRSRTFAACDVHPALSPTRSEPGRPPLNECAPPCCAIPGLGVRQSKRLANGVEYLDVLIEDFRLHVELDGRLGHDRARETWRDMRRDNQSERLRLRHLRYGWADMIDRPCEVAVEQAVILRQQGWRGTFTRCRSCPGQPAALR